MELDIKMGKKIGWITVRHFLSRIANKSFCFITKCPMSDLTTEMFKKIEISTNMAGYLPFELSIKAYI